MCLWDSRVNLKELLFHVFWVNLCLWPDWWLGDIESVKIALGAECALDVLLFFCEHLITKIVTVPVFPWRFVCRNESGRTVTQAAPAISRRHVAFFFSCYVIKVTISFLSHFCPILGPTMINRVTDVSQRWRLSDLIERHRFIWSTPRVYRCGQV